MPKIDSFKGQVFYGSRLRFTWRLSDMIGLRDAVRRVLTEVADLEFREIRSKDGMPETRRKGKFGLGRGKVLTTGVDDIFFLAADEVGYEMWDRLHQTILGILIEDLGLGPIDIRSYEVRCGVEFSSTDNLYEVLMRTLFRGSPMAELTGGKLLYEFDPLFRFVWPAGSHTKYSLDFTSNQEYSDVRGDLPREGRLLITFSRELDEEDFAVGGSIVDLVGETRHQFSQALEEFLVPKIIEPLRDALSRKG